MRFLQKIMKKLLKNSDWTVKPKCYIKYDNLKDDH